MYITGTRVFVARVGRQTKTREYKDLEAHFTANLGYSHHQKAVILDDAVFESEDNQQTTKNGPSDAPRRIVAYVGGIDLTGKYYIVRKTYRCIFIFYFLNFCFT